MSDFLQWRERPWTIWVIVGVGLASNVSSLIADTSVFNVIVTAISLVLLAALWHGNPGVRLFYIFVLFVAVALNLIGLVNDPTEHWSGFAASVAMFALVLAPPTHRWAQQREERREQVRAQSRR
jgi:hypothetical protein